MRKSWDAYFMDVAHTVSTRSTCTRHQIGAVIVRDRQIVSTGYNGAPRSIEHCMDVGCLRDAEGIESGHRHEICRAVHAEQNAIVQAAVSGQSVATGVLYTTIFPCVICAKLIVNAMIERVVYAVPYGDALSETMAYRYLWGGRVNITHLEIGDGNAGT